VCEDEAVRVVSSYNSLISSVIQKGRIQKVMIGLNMLSFEKELDFFKD